MSFIAKAALALVMVSTPVAGADIYKWVDESGRVHYGHAVPREHQRNSVAVDASPARLTDAQRLAAEARLAREKALAEEMGKRRTQTAHSPLSSIAPTGTVTKNAKLTCEHEWARFDASSACFGPYRTVHGIRAEAFKHCTEMLMPTCPKPRDR